MSHNILLEGMCKSSCQVPFELRSWAGIDPAAGAGLARHLVADAPSGMTPIPDSFITLALSTIDRYDIYI
ncbi:unnamed protein product [Danaus chrysippus]|uniref:(African queen) hypothetical protein n=1 Tax=Danaus chrysippus TaxID=151541 RepID=A0A8J2W8S2_9NEOP|nr:unnamed protein product [Danaus chrysippus]